MSPLNLEYIFHEIRDRIEYAVEHDERRLLGEIKTTFGIIEESAYGTDCKELLLFMGELETVVLDGIMGHGVKEYLPNHEKISKFFQHYTSS